jgi:hypothetical protein
MGRLVADEEILPLPPGLLRTVQELPSGVGGGGGENPTKIRGLVAAFLRGFTSIRHQ